MRHVLLAALLFVPAVTTARAGEVTGRVTMPEVCAPAISPAVVTLEPAMAGDASNLSSPRPTAAEVALIDQHGLQFTPRVQAIVLGQTVRFTNADTETHNVHIGNDFNASMSPGQPRSFTPSVPGVYRLLCDVHSHMRGYLSLRIALGPGLLAAGPVPLRRRSCGALCLKVWHELGVPIRKEVIVVGGDRSTWERSR